MAAQKMPEAEPADSMTNVESAVTRSSVITLTGVTTSSGRLFQAMGRGDDDGSAFARIYDVGKKEEWLVDGDEVQILQESHLGSGSFGQVMKGQYYGVPVAVKISTRMSVEIDPQLFNELRVFRRLRHPNIVGFYGAVFSSSKDVALCLSLSKDRRCVRLSGKRISILVWLTILIVACFLYAVFARRYGTCTASGRVSYMVTSSRTTSWLKSLAQMDLGAPWLCSRNCWILVWRKC